jgi:hypothetical protein
MDSQEAKIKVFDLIGNDFVDIYDKHTKEHFDAFPLQSSIPIVQIVGESLSPAKVLFATM